MPKSNSKITQKSNSKSAPKSSSKSSPQIIFGPVLSRRFGRSLGVDLSPSLKQCNFDCVYCELHRAKPIESMREILPYPQILRAIKQGLKSHKDISVLTFTATGEPTLYPQLYELITATKPLLPPHIKTLILSNGSKFGAQKKALQQFDIVKFSLDAGILSAFRKIDRPNRALSLEKILQDIEDFSVEYAGELVAEILLVQGHNDSEENLRAIAEFLRKLRVARVDLGSIDRPSAYQVKSVSEEKLLWASRFFEGLNVALPKRKNATMQDYSEDSKNSKDSKDSSADSIPKSSAKSATKIDIKSAQDFAKNPKCSQKSHDKINDYDKDSLLKFIATRPVEQNEAKLLFSPRTLKLLDFLLHNGKITLKLQPPHIFYTIAK